MTSADPSLVRASKEMDRQPCVWKKKLAAVEMSAAFADLTHHLSKRQDSLLPKFLDTNQEGWDKTPNAVTACLPITSDPCIVRTFEVISGPGVVRSSRSTDHRETCSERLAKLRHLHQNVRISTNATPTQPMSCGETIIQGPNLMAHMKLSHTLSISKDFAVRILGDEVHGDPWSEFTLHVPAISEWNIPRVLNADTVNELNGTICRVHRDADTFDNSRLPLTNSLVINLPPGSSTVDYGAQDEKFEPNQQVVWADTGIPRPLSGKPGFGNPSESDPAWMSTGKKLRLRASLLRKMLDRQYAKALPHYDWQLAEALPHYSATKTATYKPNDDLIGGWGNWNFHSAIADTGCESNFVSRGFLLAMAQSTKRNEKTQSSMFIDYWCIKESKGNEIEPAMLVVNASLDEYFGHPSPRGWPEIKFCVSSQPWKEFMNAFARSCDSRWGIKDISVHLLDTMQMNLGCNALRANGVADAKLSLGASGQSVWRMAWHSLDQIGKISSSFRTVLFRLARQVLMRGRKGSSPKLPTIALSFILHPTIAGATFPSEGQMGKQASQTMSRSSNSSISLVHTFEDLLQLFINPTNRTAQKSPKDEILVLGCFLCTSFLALGAYSANHDRHQPRVLATCAMFSAIGGASLAVDMQDFIFRFLFFGLVLGLGLSRVFHRVLSSRSFMSVLQNHDQPHKGEGSITKWRDGKLKADGTTS